jgi:hypothetical protein
MLTAGGISRGPSMSVVRMSLGRQQLPTKYRYQAAPQSRVSLRAAQRPVVQSPVSTGDRLEGSHE